MLELPPPPANYQIWKKKNSNFSKMAQKIVTQLWPDLGDDFAQKLQTLQVDSGHGPALALEKRRMRSRAVQAIAFLLPFRD